MMQIKVHTGQDQDAADVAAMALTAALAALQERSMAAPSSLDPSVFSQLWEAGSAVIIGAWDGAEMIGCRVVVKAPNLLNPAVVVASSPITFVRPDRRRQGVGTQLLVQGDLVLKAAGVSVSIVLAPDRLGAAAEVGYIAKAVYTERML